MEQFFANFKRDFNAELINNTVDTIYSNTGELHNDVVLLKKIFNLIDLTSLKTEDSAVSIRKLCEKVNKFHLQFADMPNVAAVCVYPVFAPVLKANLNTDTVSKAVVSAGFPSSQTFTDIKVVETKKALEFGIDEIDIVISVGEFLDSNYEFIMEEVSMIRDTLKEGDYLKVILETGLLMQIDNIWKASLLAMEGGADFIKTSTGKISVNATPEAVFVMLKAIKSFYDETGKKVGIKVAGGISSSKAAIFYYKLVEEILGEEWLNNKLFRIGASSLANNILSDISTIENGSKTAIVYF